MANESTHDPAPTDGKLTLDKLPAHLLEMVVDLIYLDTQRSMAPDKRAFLSFESIPPALAEMSTLSSFRLVCRLFSDLAVAPQFRIVTTRFSREGFERLAAISRSRVAQYTKRFIYMVPFFFVEGHQALNEAFQRVPPRRVNRDALHEKIQQQRALLGSAEDVACLTLAFQAFQALQSVQLNSVMDVNLRQLVEYLATGERRGPGLRDLVQVEWEPACKHGLQSLGHALANSSSPCNKICIPQMDQEAASSLCSTTAPRLSHFATNLESVILQFATADADRLSALSPYFRDFWSQTPNLVAIHVGFPGTHPLSLPLDTIFHGRRWPRLRSLGLQAWRLNADDLTTIIRRHRTTLCGLRLRETLLTDGRWADILPVLRQEVERLDWVSLRRINYAAAFDLQQATAGFEVHDSDDDLDEQALGALRIDVSSDDEGEEGSDAEAEEDESAAADDADGDEDADNDGDDEDQDMNSDASHSGSELQPQSDLVDLPTSDSPTVPGRRRSSTMPDVEELKDDGQQVGGRAVTKAWETWVVAQKPG